MSFLIAGLCVAARISFKSQERFLIWEKSQSSKQIVRCLCCHNRGGANATPAMSAIIMLSAHLHLMNCEYLGNHPRWLLPRATHTREGGIIHACAQERRERCRRANPGKHAPSCPGAGSCADKPGC